MCWGHPESQRWVVPPESTLHWRARASAWDRTSGLLMTGMPPCCEAPLLSSFAGAWAMHSSHCRCARRWKRGKRLANCCFVSKMSRLWTHVPSLEKRRTRARGERVHEESCSRRASEPAPRVASTLGPFKRAEMQTIVAVRQSRPRAPCAQKPRLARWSSAAARVR